MTLSHGLVLLAGIFNLAFAVFHLCFWRIFHWHTELPRLSVANRGILQILNLCLIHVFLFMGVACLMWTDELMTTRLGRYMLASFALFWAIRAIYQPAFFGLKHPLSAALFAGFVLGTILHAMPLVAAS